MKKTYNCRICGKPKDREHQSLCKECDKIKAREYRKKNKDILKNRQHKNYINNKEKFKERSKEYYKKNQEKLIEINKINYQNNRRNILDKKNSKNKLIGYNWDKFCEIRRKARYHIKIPNNTLCNFCNIDLATERHHPDYSKPLEVLFVCKKCHSKLHRRINNLNLNKLIKDDRI